MAIAGSALLALAACNGSDSNNGPGNIQDQFGGTFQSAFNSNPQADPAVNVAPIDPQPGDLPDVDPTQDPIDF